jgi:hypothetical protein
MEMDAPGYNRESVNAGDPENNLLVNGNWEKQCQFEETCSSFSSFGSEDPDKKNV